MELISVLISIYNEKIEWIELSILSMIDQTYKNIEFVIIIDNPERKEVISFLNNLFENKNIAVNIIVNPRNLGLTKSLNIGLKLCKGEYIARMDADDISFKTRLAKQLNYMKLNPRLAICGSGIIEFDQSKKLKKVSYPLTNKEIKNRLILEPSFAHPSILINRAHIKSLGIELIYDENYLLAQDYKLYADLIDKCDFGNLHEPLLYYRRSSNQLTSIKSDIQMEYSNKCRMQIFLTLTSLKKEQYLDYSNIYIIKWLSLNHYSFITLFKFLYSLEWRFFSIKHFLAFFKRLIKGPKKMM